MYRLGILTAVVLGQLTTCAYAEEPGDPRAGRDYVNANCSRCHAIEGHTERVPGEAPSFAEIANTPGMTGRALAAALDTSHKTMPNFVLAQDNRVDVIAYVLSLRSPEK